MDDEYFDELYEQALGLDLRILHVAVSLSVDRGLTLGQAAREARGTEPMFDEFINHLHSALRGGRFDMLLNRCQGLQPDRRTDIEILRCDDMIMSVACYEDILQKYRSKAEEVMRSRHAGFSGGGSTSEEF